MPPLSAEGLEAAVRSGLRAALPALPADDVEKAVRACVRQIRAISRPKPAPGAASTAGAGGAATAAEPRFTATVASVTPSHDPGEQRPAAINGGAGAAAVGGDSAGRKPAAADATPRRRRGVGVARLETRTDFMAACVQLLADVTAHRCAWPFLEDVDTAAFPDYLAVIAPNPPMSFSLVSSRLSQGAYRTPEQFVADVRLVFSNCQRYSPNSTDDVRKMERAVSEVRNAHRLLLVASALSPSPPCARCRQRITGGRCNPTTEKRPGLLH